MPCFSSITAMAWAVSKVGFPVPPLSVRVMSAFFIFLAGHDNPPQTAGLVAENTVHAGDGLHQSMTLHRLVRIHRVQAGRIKTGQPPVAGCQPSRTITKRNGSRLYLNRFANARRFSLLRMCGCQSGQSSALPGITTLTTHVRACSGAL